MKVFLERVSEWFSDLLTDLGENGPVLFIVTFVLTVGFCIVLDFLAS